MESNDGRMIPTERLPPGFADQIDRPPVTPATPQPAATAVLMRDGADGIEVLLLKRHRASGFVPGAYVFAGGRVDEADGDPEAAASVGTPPAGPPLEYWMAALREMFEETGVLLARDRRGAQCASASGDAHMESMRESLMTHRTTIAGVMRELALVPDLESMAYAAHWITPIVEPRRYDTRFFYAVMPPGCEAAADPREMSDARWLTPAAALAEFRESRLPMVFPTVRTLEDLLEHATVADAMQHARSSDVKPILPQLIRVPGGVALVVDPDGRDEPGHESKGTVSS